MLPYRRRNGIDLRSLSRQGKFLGGDEGYVDWNFLKNSVFIIIVGAGLNT